MIAALVAAALAAPGLQTGEATTRWTVTPAAAPKPAMKYRLLPEVRELNPGNPVQWYMRCFAEQRAFFFSKSAAEERARYLTMPLTELPADKLRDYGGSALTQADWGARLDTPDWGVLDRVRAEGTDLTQPELASLKILGAGLRVRFRGEVAGRRFGDAIGTAKTMLALARHLGEHPTTEGNLIGLAVANLALDAVDEMVQQPDCPNLYWALTDLPAPLVDVRKGAEGDRARLASELKPLRDAPMTDAELDEFVSHLSGRVGFARAHAGHAPRDMRAGLAARAKDTKAARGRLVEAGYTREVVEMFPPLQVVLLDEKRADEARRDDEAKLIGLAPWQADALAGRGESDRGADGLLADLLPHAPEARRGQGRVEQRLALLRCVEALRLHAAGHGGKLPAALADIDVPLPVDPFTGKPFAYELDAATARLRAEGKTAVRYEITVRK
jgi:hypothetical protein